jgi:hypothetical protein
MEHDWREIPGSFHGKDRVADFRCTRCIAWIADRSPHHLPLEALDCPFPGNVIAAEDIAPNPAGALRGEVEALLPNSATDAARALRGQLRLY